MPKLQTLILKIVFGLIVVFFVYQVFIKDERMDTRMAKLEEAQKIEVANGENKKATPSKIETLSQSQIDKMTELIDQGMIAFEIELNKVYIKPALWLAMDYKLKEDMTAAMAMYCAMKKGNDLIFVDVYDKQSGKKIAKYSQLWGYEVL